MHKRLDVPKICQMPATVYNGCMGFLPFAVVRRRRREERV